MMSLDHCYLNCFKDNKNTMSLIADDNELFKKYTKVWKKISDLVGKEFDCEPVYGNKYIKAKVNSYNNTNF